MNFLGIGAKFSPIKNSFMFFSNRSRQSPAMPMDLGFPSISSENTAKRLSVKVVVDPELKPVENVEMEMELDAPVPEAIPQPAPKNWTVPCLMSHEELNNVCEESGLVMTDYDDGRYEVEVILGDGEEQGTQCYFVKWKNYPFEESTWEPVDNLECHDKIEEYHKLKYYGCRMYEMLDRSIIEEFVTRVASEKTDLLVLKRLFLVMKPLERIDSFSRSTIKKMCKVLKSIKALKNKELEKFKPYILQVMDFSRQRYNMKIELAEWEASVKVHHNHQALVTVRNDVDTDVLPEHYIYGTNYVYSQLVARPSEEARTFCSCNDCSKSKDCCRDMMYEFPYNKNGLLKIEPGFPIYECNPQCKCGPTCINRVVQKGQQVKVEIFKTQNRGWGLKTLEPIKRGQFLMEYIGEVITNAEADFRSKTIPEGQFYLFDLDFEQQNYLYTVDAKNYGNSAHFINHSCDPNLSVYSVWIYHLDSTLPRLAFFARRAIRVGEELTFDYKTDNSAVLKKTVQCKCGAANCRKYLF